LCAFEILGHFCSKIERRYRRQNTRTYEKRVHERIIRKKKLKNQRSMVACEVICYSNHNHKNYNIIKHKRLEIWVNPCF
jgi:hypothetical protein